MITPQIAPHCLPAPPCTNASGKAGNCTVYDKSETMDHMIIALYQALIHCLIAYYLSMAYICQSHVFASGIFHVKAGNKTG